MPDPLYVATTLAVCVAITVALRALPFAMKGMLRESALVEDLGRWMPLGAVAILAVYCLSSIDLTDPRSGAGPIAGTVVTVVMHAWRQNAALSILAGTTACLLVLNTL